MENGSARKNSYANHTSCDRLRENERGGGTLVQSALLITLIFVMAFPSVRNMIDSQTLNGLCTPSMALMRNSSTGSTMWFPNGPMFYGQGGVIGDDAGMGTYCQGFGDHWADPGEPFRQNWFIFFGNTLH